MGCLLPIGERKRGPAGCWTCVSKIMQITQRRGGYAQAECLTTYSFKVRQSTEFVVRNVPSILVLSCVELSSELSLNIPVLSEQVQDARERVRSGIDTR